MLQLLQELLEMKTPDLLHQRMLKFRNLGGFIEGEPVDPSKKVNMKKKDKPIIQKTELVLTPDIDLYEVEKLKQELLKPKEDASSEAPGLVLNEMAEKLKKEIDEEFNQAYESMGLKDRLELLRKEIKKARSSQSQHMDPKLLEEIKELHQEFTRRLPEYPNYADMNYKLDMLKQISEAQKISEGNQKVVSLKQEINTRVKEVMDRTDVKEKLEMLKADIANAGVSKASDLDDKSKEKIVKVKKEIESEITKTLKSLQLDVELVASKEKASKARGLVDQPLYSELKDKMDELNQEIQEGIEDVIQSTDLKNKIEMLKLEVTMAGKSPDAETQNKINTLKQEVKESLAEAMSSPSLIGKYEKLKQEIASISASSSNDREEGSSGDLNGGLKQDAYTEDGPILDTSKVGFNTGFSS